MKTVYHSANFQSTKINFKKVEKNQKKYLTMGKGCGNINELRQEEGASSKEFKKSSKKGLTKASGCDNIDKLLAWSESTSKLKF
ncbi:MAG: hypothetical protein IJW15_03100 [Clostridia bacterium]|nr:hypothetical protein [Clostridia bacterium]